MSRPEFIKVPDRAAYYDEAESWAEDRLQTDRKSRRIAWMVAAGAGAIALLEAVALVALMPLKQTVPYVVSVDRQTGYVELAQRLQPGGTLSQRDAVIQSALVQYVLARETFDASDLTANYRKVQLWSDPSVAARYVAQMARANPDSPLNVYPGSATLKVTVKGVTMVDKDTALVRFDAQRLDPATTAAPVQPFAATISFGFSGEPLKMEDRFVNPLGFQVTRYRRDAETTTPVDATVDDASTRGLQP